MTTGDAQEPWSLTSAVMRHMARRWRHILGLVLVGGLLWAATDARISLAEARSADVWRSFAAGAAWTYIGCFIGLVVGVLDSRRASRRRGE